MHKRYHKRGGKRTGDGIKNVFEETDMQVQEAQRIPKKINPNRPTPRHIIIKMARFPWCLVGKESACSAEDPSLIPGLGRSAGEGIGYPLQNPWASLVGQLVKNLPAMQETWVEKIPWEGKGYPPTPVFQLREFHGLYSPWGRKELDTTEQLSLSLVVQWLRSSNPHLQCRGRRLNPWSEN